MFNSFFIYLNKRKHNISICAWLALRIEIRKNILPCRVVAQKFSNFTRIFFFLCCFFYDCLCVKKEEKTSWESN